MESVAIKVQNEYLRKSLITEFEIRCKKNAAYSIRAYSRDLGIDHTLLSRIINKKREISTAIRLKLCRHFNLDLQNKSIGSLNSSKLSKYAFLEEVTFKVISDWTHFAILSLMDTKNFRSNTKWISQRLNICFSKANASLFRLEELGFIDRSDNESWKLIKNSTNWSNYKSTNIAKMEFQKEILNKAKYAVDNVKFEDRLNSSLMVSINKDCLEQVKEKIELFKESLNQFIEEQGEHDEVYQFSFSMFPLTNLDKNKSNILGEEND